MNRPVVGWVAWSHDNQWVSVSIIKILTSQSAYAHAHAHTSIHERIEIFTKQMKKGEKVGRENEDEIVEAWRCVSAFSCTSTECGKWNSFFFLFWPVDDQIDKREGTRTHIVSPLCVHHNSVWNVSSAMKTTHTNHQHIPHNVCVYLRFFFHTDTLRCRKERIENGTGVGK